MLGNMGIFSRKIAEAELLVDPSSDDGSLSSLFEPHAASTPLEEDLDRPPSSLESAYAIRIAQLEAENARFRDRDARYKIKIVATVRGMLADAKANKEIKHWMGGYKNRNGEFDYTRMVANADAGQLPVSLQKLLEPMDLNLEEFMEGLQEINPKWWSTARKVAATIGAALAIATALAIVVAACAFAPACVGVGVGIGVWAAGAAVGAAAGAGVASGLAACMK